MARWIFWTILLVAPPMFVAMVWSGFRTWLPFNIWGLAYTHEHDLYFRSSAWVVGQGTLYLDIPSEYPLLANLLFASARLVAGIWHSQSSAMLDYEVTWVAFGWWAWLATLALLWRMVPHRFIWVWLNPVTLWFSIYMYDGFVVLATLLAFHAARNDRVRLAAFWLGISIALKGYAAFALPAFIVWIAARQGRKEAAIGMGVALAPLALSLLVVLVPYGVTAMLAPFRTQIGRGPDGSGTWDVLLPLGLGTGLARGFPLLPTGLQATSALLAALLRPKTFPEFVRAYLVAVLGFVTFCTFSSPQYLMWFVVPVAFSESVTLLIATLALSVATIVYFPFAYYHGSGRLIYRLSLLLVTMLRTTLFALCLLPLGLLHRMDAFVAIGRPPAVAVDARLSESQRP